MKYEVVIVGSGVAGFSVALSIAEINPHIKILLISKNSAFETNSAMAQGGIAAVINKKLDSFEKHFADTMASGGFISEKKVTSFFVRHAPEAVKNLQKVGVTFDTDIHGNLHLALEGGHSENRIVHAQDKTGYAIVSTLFKIVKAKKNISVTNSLFVYRLLKAEENRVCGILAFNTKTKQPIKILCDKIVLATGGSGQVFGNTTNPICATGDGIALAKNVDAKISNMHFVQFHPTAFFRSTDNPKFLISEAVRGFGAYVVDHLQNRFLFEYDHRGELATRDIVSKAIIIHQKKFKKHAAFLDLRHISHQKFSVNFPKVAQFLIENNIDVSKDLIPIMPAAHYQNGGIAVNKYGLTSISNLYAIGECAYTGLHGNNRLASNSIIEALVFAKLVAKHLMNSSSNEGLNKRILCHENLVSSNYNQWTQARLQLQKIMENYLLFSEDLEGLKIQLRKLNYLELTTFENFNDVHFSVDFFETKNMLATAKIILQSAINHQKSLINESKKKHENYATVG